MRAFTLAAVLVFLAPIRALADDAPADRAEAAAARAEAAATRSEAAAGRVEQAIERLERAIEEATAGERHAPRQARPAR